MRCRSTAAAADIPTVSGISLRETAVDYRATIPTVVVVPAVAALGAGALRGVPTALLGNSAAGGAVCYLIPSESVI